MYGKSALMNQALTSQSLPEKLPVLPEMPAKIPEKPSKPLEYGEIKEHISLKDAPARDEYTLKVVESIRQLPEAKRRLVAKERLFVSEFLKCGTPRKAAISAGYAVGTANQAGKWLRSNKSSNDKLHVFLAIHSALLESDERAIDIASKALATAKIDAHYVERKTVEQLQKANAEIPAYTTTDAKGEVKEHFKYNPTAALKALELLGKHKHIKAFDNTIEHKSSDLANLLGNLKTGFKPPNLVKDITPKVQPQTLTAAKPLPTGKAIQAEASRREAEATKAKKRKAKAAKPRKPRGAAKPTEG